MIYKKGDKVKLMPYNVFGEYDDEWKEFWDKNTNTIFTIHSVIGKLFIYYNLCFPNGEIVIDPADFMARAEVFVDEELEPYTVNSLPDELFEL